MNLSEKRAGPKTASHVCALLTCFNRRTKTLASLEALAASAARAQVELSAVLVDDGSTDGTDDAVRQQFPWVRVHRVQGDLYWCRGMHLAFDLAKALDPDHYLLLNDDTVISPEAISSLVLSFQELASERQAPLILVGSCRDSALKDHTYGGVRLASKWFRTRFAKVPPTHQAQMLDTFDGNFVLIARDAAKLVGNLDPAFEHAMGDYDYGLRAKRQGVESWLAPGWHAICDDNPKAGTFMDRSLAKRQRWKLMLSRKGLPVRSWWRFNFRHGGPFWLITFLWPYFRVAFDGRPARELRKNF